MLKQRSHFIFVFSIERKVVILLAVAENTSERSTQTGYMCFPNVFYAILYPSLPKMFIYFGYKSVVEKIVMQRM
jgi:hypothetical protein